MGWIISLGVLTLLAVLPLGISVVYDEDGTLAKLIFGPVRITLYPRPKKDKKEAAGKTSPRGGEKKPAKAKEAEASLPKPPQPPKKEKTKEKKGGSLKDFLPLVKVALDFLGDFRRKLRLDRLEVKLILAGDDPCDLAVNYGRTWAAISNLLPQLDRLFVIKKRDIEAECDFTASETLVIARLDLTITLGRLLALAVCYGIRVLKEFLTLKKNQKGGAVI